MYVHVCLYNIVFRTTYSAYVHDEFREKILEHSSFIWFLSDIFKLF